MYRDVQRTNPINCTDVLFPSCFIQLIDRTRIVIVPSLNPDGREIAQERGCTSKIGQTNAHGRDLDTDFTGKAN